MIYTCSIETLLGRMTAAAEDGSLIGLWFIDQKYYPIRTAGWNYEPDLPVFEALRKQLALYFTGRAAAFDIPLKPAGSSFRKAVWNILIKIPPGEVTTYGQIARDIAKTRGLTSISAQAVGGAVGHNPISILIPCHRVVGSGGALTGYAGGLERKAALLRIEKANVGALWDRPCG